MLFMVIERFKDNQLGSVGKRFQNKGRMLPDGVVYHAPAASKSWKQMTSNSFKSGLHGGVTWWTSMSCRF
jgi:hypothetical protein